MGGCWTSDALRQSIVVSHFGFNGSEHLWMDSSIWSLARRDRSAWTNHKYTSQRSCYTPGKDIVAPVFFRMSQHELELAEQQVNCECSVSNSCFRRAKTLLYMSGSVTNTAPWYSQVCALLHLHSPPPYEALDPERWQPRCGAGSKERVSRVTQTHTRGSLQYWRLARLRSAQRHLLPCTQVLQRALVHLIPSITLRLRARCVDTALVPKPHHDMRICVSSTVAGAGAGEHTSRLQCSASLLSSNHSLSKPTMTCCSTPSLLSGTTRWTSSSYLSCCKPSIHKPFAGCATLHFDTAGCWYGTRQRV